MKKVRRKLTCQSGETKMRTVWHSPCKIGTHNLKTGYFFDEPKVGMTTQVVWIPPSNDVMYFRAWSVYIEEVRSDGIVYCTKM